MSSFNNTTNFDNLLLQSLMGRLQIRPQNPQTNSLLNQTLEELLFDPTNPILSSDDEDDDSNKTQLSKEESKLEKEIIKVILSGKSETLKPNSGQAVSIGEHHICVGFHEEEGSDYRVWEWHGHIMLFDEENGYSPEYIYGNYFQRIVGGKVSGVVEEEKSEKEKEEKIGNLGLRELIGREDSNGGRILHRNLNSGSSRYELMLSVHVTYSLLQDLDQELVSLCAIASSWQ
ncbi:hypothetical protein RJ641_028303 [Dillenia turbinata]|uniref:Uncharacterized protein n=1 Tax=Dillenia turbinata TaxID=194707 RepID=A0AAN8W7Q6_9MAGN